MLTVCVLAEDSAPCLHFCLPLVPPPSALLASWKSDTQNAGDLLRQAVEVDPTNAIVLSMQADYLEHEC